MNMPAPRGRRTCPPIEHVLPVILTVYLYAYLIILASDLRRPADLAIRLLGHPAKLPARLPTG